MISKSVQGIVAVLAIVIIVVGGMLLGVVPALERTSEARVGLSAAQAQNAESATTLDLLQAQRADVETLLDAQTKIRLSVPNLPGVGGFVTELGGSAATQGVGVQSVTVGTPTAATIAPASSTSDGAPGDAPVADGELFSVAIDISISGPYEGVIEVIGALQTGTRLTSLTGFTLSIDGANVSAQLSVLVYVLA